jgi:Tfp pilus assembly protein PilN
MTAAETTPAMASAAAPVRLNARRWLAFGSGFGIAAGASVLELAMVRVRPSGARFVQAASIAGYRTRPAAEWGGEVTRFLAAGGETQLAATVLLPREEVIVRTLQLPGVSDKDMAAAIELQLDTLHPWGDDEIAWTWFRAGDGSAQLIVVGLIRKALLTSWETLFSEAGIPVAAFTFSSAAIHAALRIWNAAPHSFLFAVPGEGNRCEVYGESEARPFYSSQFAIGVERAIAVARAELRLAGSDEAGSLAAAIPQPDGAAQSFETVSPFAWAAALSAAAPLATRLVNFLPPERRASSARRKFLLTGILSVVLAITALAAFVALPAIQQSRYETALATEIRRSEPAAQRAQNFEKAATQNRARAAALDEIRLRSKADLDILNELTRILPPQVWTNSIEIYPDSVVIAGEADQAAPLLKLLDSSPLFQNSEFSLSVTRSTTGEQFRIRTQRRGRVGRTTP